MLAKSSLAGRRLRVLTIAARAVQNDPARARSHLEATKTGMVRGQEVAADRHAKRKQTASFDFLGIGASRPEPISQKFHAPIVNAPQPFSDGGVTSGPIADRQIYIEQAAGRKGKLTRQPELILPAAPLSLHSIEHFVDAFALPCVEHGSQQRLAIGEVAVKPALGNPERLCQGLDSNRVDPTGCKCQ